MYRKTVSGIVLMLLLTSMLSSAFIIQPVKAEGGTIYIRADGAVDPLDAPILNVENVYYTFTADIYDSIVVERNNIVVDGAGYTVQGTGSGKGIDLRDRRNITVKNTNIKAFGYGFYLWDSYNNVIRDNTVSNNSMGIILHGSSNTISSNRVTNNSDTGIELAVASYNTISDNAITHNGLGGIDLGSSGYNTLSGNIMVSNGYNFGVHGHPVSAFTNYVDTSNTVDGKPIYYWVNEQDKIVPSDAGCVIIVKSTSITVRDLSLTRNMAGVLLAYTQNSIVQNITSESNHYYGIELYGSNNNTLMGNAVADNAIGIFLHSSSWNVLSGTIVTNNSGEGIGIHSSSGNTIYDNSIVENGYGGISPIYYKGIWLYESSDNKIYHNNFIRNTAQVYVTAGYTNVWDDGYPSGGNYWSDYTGADEKSGPNQDEPGRDGIVDTPYIIDEDNRDRYPLVNPWTLAPPAKFRIGDWVRTTANLNVREGPGLNYTIISTMPLGTIGQIVGGPVEADGYVWWDVNYALGVRGWSAQNWLELGEEPPEEPRFLTLPFKDSNIVVGWIFDPNKGHYGIDFIKGDINDVFSWQSFDVVAAADGEAFWAEEKDAEGNYKGWGKYVYVKHDVEDAVGRNYYTLYAHLESVNPSIPGEGEGTVRVWRGETIGWAGDTGSPGLTHLHFEVHEGDARSIAKISDRVDPYDLNQDRDSLYGEKAVSIRCGQNYLWITDPPFPAFNYPPIPIVIHYPSSAGWIGRFVEGLRAFLTSSGYYEVGEDITFYGSLSGDLDGEIISYEWNFEDGTVKSGKKVEHTYSQEGTYTVTLTVVDDRNEKSRRSSELFISDPTPELIEKLKQNINILSDRSINYLSHDVLEGSKKAAGAADSFRQAIEEDMIDLTASLVFELIPSSIPKENPLWQKIAEEILDETAEAIQKWLLRTMISSLETEYSYYDLFIGDVENEIEDRINSIAYVTDELLNEIENLDLTPEELRSYLKDLRMRRRANSFLSTFYGGQADLLHHFDEIKEEDANSWTLRWGKRIYQVSATFLSLKTGFLGTGLKFTVDRYSDLSSLSVNAQTFLLSHYTLQRSVFNPSQDPFQNIVEGIYQNTIQGLENIKNRRKPNIVEGRISIEEDGKIYRIEIENTGRDKAEFKLIVGYETTYTSYELLPGIGRYYNLPTYTSYPADEEWIEIELDGKEIIEVEIPKESSYVSVWLLGRGDTGIYGLDFKRRAIDEPWYGLVSSWISFPFGSPGEPRVYDSQGRVTGLLNGEIREEIPNSIYDSEDNIIVITSPSSYPFEFSSYRYEVMGTDTGTYSMELTSVQNGESNTFTATDIPTSANAVHQYTVDWDALALGEEGVTVMVDSDGDGVFEHTFASDSELSQSEYVAAINAIITWITDCHFNEIESFEAIFTRYRNTELYKLAATNPGTFYFNILVNNTWPEPLNITIIYFIDANFTLKGGKPIRVYANLERCACADITADCTFSDNTITVYNVAPNAIIYVTIRLDYALKGTTWTEEEVETWYSEHSFNATVRSITSKVVITDPEPQTAPIPASLIFLIAILPAIILGLGIFIALLKYENLLEERRK